MSTLRDASPEEREARLAAADDLLGPRGHRFAAPDRTRERDLALEGLYEKRVGIIDELAAVDREIDAVMGWRDDDMPSVSRAEAESTVDARIFGRDDDPGTHRDADSPFSWPAA